MTAFLETKTVWHPIGIVPGPVVTEVPRDRPGRRHAGASRTPTAGGLPVRLDDF